MPAPRIDPATGQVTNVGAGSSTPPASAMANNPPPPPAETGPPPTTVGDVKQGALDWAAEMLGVSPAVAEYLLEIWDTEIVEDPETGEFSLREIIDPQQAAIDQQNKDIQQKANEITLKGLAGEIEIDPSVEADIEESAAQLDARLLRQLGPGAEGSDSWNRAKAEFEKHANSLRYGIRHGQMTTADAMATNRGYFDQSQKGQKAAGIGSAMNPYYATAGVLAGTLDPYFRAAEGRKNRDAARDSSQDAMLGGLGGAAVIGGALM